MVAILCPTGHTGHVFIFLRGTNYSGVPRVTPQIMGHNFLRETRVKIITRVPPNYALVFFNLNLSYRINFF